MKKQRGTRRRNNYGGNPLRKKLVNCIKDIVMYLACSSNYNNNDEDNGQMPNMSRLKQRFIRLQNIDEAIEQLTNEMLANPAYQTIIAGSNIMQKTYSIIEWYGLHAYYSLSLEAQYVIRQKILQCTTVDPLTTTLVAATRNPTAKQAFTADVVNDLSEYLQPSRR